MYTPAINGSAESNAKLFSSDPSYSLRGSKLAVEKLSSVLTFSIATKSAAYLPLFT
jgi:hypothetical protein